MTRAQLRRRVKRLVELRAVCELVPDWQRQPARRRYERAIRLLAFDSALPEDGLATVAERFFVGWIRRGRTPTIRRAKARASERTWGEAMRLMRQTADVLTGREAT